MIRLFKFFAIIFLINIFTLLISEPIYAMDFNCGSVFYKHSSNNCLCEHDEFFKKQCATFGLPPCYDYYCCGWINQAGGCDARAPEQQIESGLSQEILDQLNPLKIGQSPYIEEFSTPAGIINRLIIFIFPIAGLILFVLIVWGGFEMLTSPANKSNYETGKNRVVAAVIGFILLFCSYWIIQIIEVIFSVNILGQ